MGWTLLTQLSGLPEDLRVAFLKRYEEFWADPGSSVFENADTERVCRIGNKAEEKAFAFKEEQGCCGSHDEKLELLGVRIRYGFNHDQVKE